MHLANNIATGLSLQLGMTDKAVLFDIRDKIADAIVKFHQRAMAGEFEPRNSGAH